MADVRWGKSVAGALAALVLFAFSAAGWLVYDGARLQTAYEQKAESKAQGYAARRSEAIESRCVPLPAAAEAKCISEEAQTARQGAHDEYDLQSQLVTSAWTRQMGIAAIIGMAFGVLGVALVFFTFQQTRRAAESAKETLKAFVAVERPRLVLGIGACWQDGDTTYFKMNAENVGKTSAHVLAAHYNILEDRYPDRPFRLIDEIDRAVHPGKPVKIWTIGSDLKAHKMPYVGGYIEYRSAFGDTHKSYFCVLLSNNPVDAYGHGGSKAESQKDKGWPEDT